MCCRWGRRHSESSSFGMLLVYSGSSIFGTRLKDPKVLLPTIIAGLQTYFDRALGANLLYRFERPQYAEIRKKYVTGPTVQVGQEKEMSAIYGAEHFLRMLGECSMSRERRV